MTSVISPLVRHNYAVANPYVDVQSLRNTLIEEEAVVVVDEETQHFLGVLTVLDMVRQPRLLAVDCLTEKPAVAPSASVSEALALMQRHPEHVLPVLDEGRFEGLVFKSDLLQEMARRTGTRMELQEQITHTVNANFHFSQTRQLIDALYNSTTAVKFLVAPDFSLLFFNRVAYENSMSVHKRELKVGDSLLEYTRHSPTPAMENLKADFEKALTGEMVLRECNIQYEQASMWFRSEYSPVLDEGAVIAVSITVLDITERKTNELHINNQNSILRDIIHTQSHELRRPVANIIGLIGLLNTSSLGEQEREILSMIVASSKELETITSSIVNKAYYWKDTRPPSS